MKNIVWDGRFEHICKAVTGTGVALKYNNHDTSETTRLKEYIEDEN